MDLWISKLIQHDILDQFLDVIPTKTVILKEKKTQNGFQAQQCTFVLEIETYTKIFEYLLSRRKVDLFQYCLDTFERNTINVDQLVGKVHERIEQNKMLQGDKSVDHHKIELDILYRLLIMDRKFMESF